MSSFTSHIHSEEEIVGMYLTDNPNLNYQMLNNTAWKVKDETKYLPIIDFINIKCDNDIKFTLGENINDDLSTYNANTRLSRLDKNIRLNTKINVSTNDLYINPIHLMMNCTEYNISSVSRNGIPKLYLPLESSRLESFRGSVLILTVHTVTSPVTVKNVYGYVNYLDNLRAKYLSKRDSSNSYVYKRLDYIIDKLSNIKSVMDGLSSNTIKLVTMSRINQQEFFIKDKRRNIHLEEQDVTISLEDPVKMDDHPYRKFDAGGNGKLINNIRENGVSCFIVDNNDKLSDRYYMFAGKVMKIPKVKDSTKVDGLYLLSIDNNKSIDKEDIIDLEDVDKNPFIFKSEEEAKFNSDVKKRGVEDIEVKKIKMQDRSIELKAEYDNKLKEMETYYKTKQLEMEERSKELDLIYQEKLKNMKLEQERIKSKNDENKFQFDTFSLKNKYQYEQEKYTRDSTMETIKTIGSVAGLLAGGYALYKTINR